MAPALLAKKRSGMSRIISLPRRTTNDDYTQPSQPQPGPTPQAPHAHEEISASAAHPRVPDGVYIMAVTKTFPARKMRSYGLRICLKLAIMEGEFCGIELPMYFRPSHWPTSRFYRHWTIAADRVPSRNAKLSHRIFRGKVFRAATVTVRPRHELIVNGKTCPGELLP